VKSALSGVHIFPKVGRYTSEYCMHFSNTDNQKLFSFISAETLEIKLEHVTINQVVVNLI
jgi:hypothetical protein